MNYDFLERTAKPNLGYRHRYRSVFSRGLQPKMHQTNTVRITPRSNEKIEPSYYTRVSFFKNFSQNITNYFFVVPIPLDTKYWDGGRKGCMCHHVKDCQICEKVPISFHPAISWKIIGMRYKRVHIFY